MEVGVTTGYVGSPVGTLLGAPVVGSVDGSSLGIVLGTNNGVSLGQELGSRDGTTTGADVGSSDCFNVGKVVLVLGNELGDSEGLNVGSVLLGESVGVDSGFAKVSGHLLR